MSAFKADIVHTFNLKAHHEQRNRKTKEKQKAFEKDAS